MVRLAEAAAVLSQNHMEKKKQKTRKYYRYRRKYPSDTLEGDRTR